MDAIELTRSYSPRPQMSTSFVYMYPGRIGRVECRVGECNRQDHGLVDCIVDFVFPQIASGYDLVGIDVVELGLEVGELNRDIRARSVG